MILFYSMGYSRDVNGRFTFIIRDFFLLFSFVHISDGRNIKDRLLYDFSLLHTDQDFVTASDYPS